MSVKAKMERVFEKSGKKGMKPSESVRPHKLEKARPHKYIKREGGPKQWKYTYYQEATTKEHLLQQKEELVMMAEGFGFNAHDYGFDTTGKQLDFEKKNDIVNVRLNIRKVETPDIHVTELPGIAEKMKILIDKAQSFGWKTTRKAWDSMHQRGRYDKGTMMEIPGKFSITLEKDVLVPIPKPEVVKEEITPYGLALGKIAQKLVDSIRANDKVTIVNRFGQQHTGRAVMRGSAGWVLNMGGAHGTPAIASEENVVKVRSALKKSLILEEPFLKARPHKYIKRLGARGKYQYFYPFVKEESGDWDKYKEALLAKEKKDGTVAKDKAGNIISTNLQPPLAYKEGKAISEKLEHTTVADIPKEIPILPGPQIETEPPYKTTGKMAEPKVMKLDEPFKIKKPLHEPTEDKYYKEWAHEKMRITNATWGENKLRRRLNAITQPQKLFNFARALEDENLHDLAGEAYNKLKAMGYDSGGTPFKVIATPPKLAPKVKIEDAIKIGLEPFNVMEFEAKKFEAKKKLGAKPKSNLAKVQGIVANLGEDYSIYRGYSGRGMYGDKCLGIVGPDVESIMREASKRGLKRKDARTDNMGLDMIVYWPDIKEDEPSPEERGEVKSKSVGEPGRRIDIGYEEYEKSFRLEEPFLKGRGPDKKKRKSRGQLSVPEQHQLRIVTDNLRNPLKGKFLGGPTGDEAKEIYQRLTGKQWIEPFEKGRGKDKKPRKRRGSTFFSPKEGDAYFDRYKYDKDPGTFEGRMKNLGVPPKFIIGTKEHKAEKEKRQYGTHIPKQGG